MYDAFSPLSLSTLIEALKMSLNLVDLIFFLSPSKKKQLRYLFFLIKMNNYNMVIKLVEFHSIIIEHVFVQQTRRHCFICKGRYE